MLEEEPLSRSRTALLALSLSTLLLAPLLSCDRGNWPGAPEGYNYRTAHIAWRLEGNVRGTSERYVETSGFKDGKLVVKRFAQIGRFESDSIYRGKPPTKVDSWLINDQGTQFLVMKDIKLTVKRKMNLDVFIRMNSYFLWREVLWGLIPRKELPRDLRVALQKVIGKPDDATLKKVGAKITTDTFLGHKVTRYEMPLDGGRALLLMYGEIPLKTDIKYKRSNVPIHNIMTATKFELNKRLSDSPFTPPKNFKIRDSRRPIPAG